MLYTRHFIVIGRVQGVGFRAATRDRARMLGLRGWVRNLADGDVEVQATGNDDALAALQHWLTQGPSTARVDDLKQRSVAADDTPQSFYVR